MKAYRFHEEADQEFHEQIGYYLVQSRSAAERFVIEVATAVRGVREYPESGSPISRRVRQVVLNDFQYSVLYIDMPSEIVIVAVAPHRRRPGYWRKRLRNLSR